MTAWLTLAAAVYTAVTLVLLLWEPPPQDTPLDIERNPEPDLTALDDLP